MPDLPPSLPTQEQVLTALADCGLDRAGLSISYDRDVQSDVVHIKVAARATDRQFECIRSATRYGFVTFEDAGQERAYNAYFAAQSRTEMIASARKELEDMGKLEGMPVFGQFPDAGSFFHALEAHCGYGPGQALQETTPGEWSILPQASAGAETTGFERLTCLLSSIMAQDEDLSARGLRFGFVGNEAFPEQ